MSNTEGYERSKVSARAATQSVPQTLSEGIAAPHDPEAPQATKEPRNNETPSQLFDSEGGEAGSIGEASCTWVDDSGKKHEIPILGLDDCVFVRDPEHDRLKEWRKRAHGPGGEVSGLSLIHI